ncbi:MAG: hypothetical protein ACRCX2_10550 [Paraclostridium sp.]
MHELFAPYQYDFYGFITDFFYREFESDDGHGIFFPELGDNGMYLFFEDFQLEWIGAIDHFMKSADASLRLAVRSCKGAGKTRMLALTMIWGCMCFKAPKVRGMSSTQRQTKDVLLNACRELLVDAGFDVMFQMNKFSFYMLDENGDPSELNVIAGVAATTNTMDSVAGDHSKSLNLYVIDEASTMQEEIYDVLQGIFTSGKAIMILAGNTTDTTSSSLFYKVFNYPEFDIFHRIHVPASALKRTRNNNTLDRLASYPVGSIKYKMFIDAEFCDSRDLIFLLESDVRPAFDIQRQHYIPDMTKCNNYCVIGIDMAYGIGRDYTAAVLRCNNQVEVIFYSNTQRPHEIIPRIVEWNNQGARIIMDVSGIGRDVFSALFDLGIRNIPDIALQSRPLNDTKFVNRKSELLFMTKEWFLKANPYIRVQSTLERETLITECKMLRWEVDELGKYDLGRKNKNEKSPDLLDALSFTFFYGTITKELNMGGLNVRSIRSPWGAF